MVAEQKRTAFNAVLAKVLYPAPEWSIEVSGRGDYYIRFRTKNSSHSSEGLGEGIISLFVIIDALYDSNPNDTIVIDEPELSLHPSLQRKLAMLFTEYASDRQIVLSTHSPYFINLEALKNDATIVRAHLNCGQSHLSQLSRSAAKGIAGPLKDVNNPHTWGVNAREAFFLEDHVVLVEGPEDVIFYERVVQDQLGVHLQGNFFGWGVGGADKMSKIVLVLKDLGFSRVVGILDTDKISVQQRLSKEFPEYHFFAIPAKDVRTKSDRKPPVDGLLDDANKKVRPEYFEQTKQLFIAANEYLTGNV